MTARHPLYQAALDADDAFTAAIQSAGFKGRWEMPSNVMRTHDTICRAYSTKVVADVRWLAALKDMRTSEMEG